MRPFLLGMGICFLAAGCSSPPVEQGRILLTKEGNGNGEVVPAAGWPPDGKAHRYPLGSRVSLEAIPDKNSVFERWEGDLPTGADATIPRLETTVGGEQSFKARFRRESRSLLLEAEGDAGLGALLPPPGTYRFRQGDVVLLQALFWSGDAGVRWEGPVSGQGAAVTVTMDADITVRASFLPGAGTPPFAPPPVPVSETDAPAFFACMAGGDLFGWFTATPFAGPSWGAGITRLCHTSHPFSPVFRRTGLNFEHVMNGHERDAERAYHSPRHDRIVVEVRSPRRVAVTWPEKDASWALDCKMEYSFSGGPFLDTLFHVVPRADEAPLGYLAFMWASYLENALAPDIHFVGRLGDAAGWQTMRTERLGGKWTEGVVPFEGEPPLPQKPEAYFFNLMEKKGVSFTEPFYYGLVDGDGRRETSGDAMAFVMMLTDAASSRFSVWNWTEGGRQPAWDWQWVLERPQAGTLHRHQSRMAYLPFESPEEIRELHRAWDGRWPEDDPILTERACIEAIPPGISPVEEMDDPIILAGRLLDEGNRGQAEALLLRAVAHPEYTVAACLRLAEMTAGLSGEDVAAYWQTLVQRHPRSIPIAVQQGEILEKAADLDGAEAAYRRAMTLAEPGDEAAAVSLGRHAARVLGRKGRTALDARDWESAAACYREAMALDPPERWHQVCLGEALAGMGDFQNALAQYRAVLHDHPDGRVTSRLVDDAYIAMSDPSGRVGEWRRMAEANPGEPVCWLHLGKAQETAGGLEDAEASFRRALSLDAGLDPVLTGDIRAALAAVLGARGRQALEGGSFSRADAFFREAGGLDPNGHQHKVGLGEALMGMGDFRSALELFRTVLRDHPNERVTARLLDETHKTLGDMTNRLKEWREMAEAHPEEPAFQLHLGMAQESAGGLEDAEASYRRGLSMDTGTDPVLTEDIRTALAGALGARGRLALEEGDFVRAAAFFREAMGLDPRDRWHEVSLGRALAGQGDHQKALELYRGVLRDHPDGRTTSQLVNEAYGALKDAPGRVREWERMTGEHPDTAFCWMELGLALGDLSDLDAAETALRRALLLGEAGDPAPAKEIKGHLARILGRKGEDALEKRRWQPAAALFGEASKLDPGNRWHEVRLGEALAGMGDYPAALAQYRGVLRDHPDGRVTSRLVDEAYVAMQDPAGRVEEWRRMTAEHPDTASCWLHLGLALEASGKTAEALEAFEKARALDPGLEGLSPSPK